MKNLAYLPHRNLIAIRYDSENSVLQVQFPNGTYNYGNVQTEFVARIEAETDNVARLLGELKVNSSQYPCTKLG